MNIRSAKVVTVTCVLSAFAAFAPRSNAAEFSRTFIIHHVAGVSTDRPAFPGAQSVFRIYSQSPQSWGSSTCRADSADLSMDDYHMLPIVLRAWKQGLQVTVVVESTLRIDTTDTVCKIVAINTN